MITNLLRPIFIPILERKDRECHARATHAAWTKTPTLQNREGWGVLRFELMVEEVGEAKLGDEFREANGLGRRESARDRIEWDADETYESGADIDV
jgi:hypothetical protein